MEQRLRIKGKKVFIDNVEDDGRISATIALLNTTISTPKFNFETGKIEITITAKSLNSK